MGLARLLTVIAVSSACWGSHAYAQRVHTQSPQAPTHASPATVDSVVVQLLLSDPPSDATAAVQTLRQSPQTEDPENDVEVLPRPAHGDFPRLPPDPYATQLATLPEFEQELSHHGGSSLYGDVRDVNLPHLLGAAPAPRLPEDWQKPTPFEGFAEFLGADPIFAGPNHWFGGHEAYYWEPRLVGYGRYSLFAFLLDQDNRRQNVIGHQLLTELDLRLTGTERFHVQFRPLGRGASGGSYYQLTDPTGYVDNSTGEPTRYWFEAELHSLLGPWVSPFEALDYHITLGKFPFALHNTLLMDDEIRGLVLTKNSLYAGATSNVNLQAICAVDEVDAFEVGDASLYGISAFIDHRRVFYETSYLYVEHPFDATRNTHYAALSRTQLFCLISLAGRALHKWGDEGGAGDGQLFTLESNATRVFNTQPLGINKGVFYGNAFLATKGWTAVAGSNFNRLRTAFEVNPLERISAGIAPGDTAGLSLGVQLFRHHEDESWTPEVAWQEIAGESVWGIGLRYQRKLSVRSFFETLSVLNGSDDSRFDRAGVFWSYNLLF